MILIIREVKSRKYCYSWCDKFGCYGHKEAEIIET